MSFLNCGRNKAFRLVVCLLVSAACLYLAARGIDFERTLHELRKSLAIPVFGAVFFLFLSFWVRAYRWCYLLLSIKKISTGPLFRSVLIGFMGNYLLPFRAGEVMRAVSVGQTQNISKAAALGSIFVERAFDGIVLALTPFLLLALMDLPHWMVRVSIAALTVLLAGLMTIVFATRRGRTEAWLNWLAAVLPQVFARRLRSMVEEFLHGMKSINHAGALLPVLLLSVLCWIFHGMYFFLLFKALQLNLSLWVALIVQVVIGFGVVLPAAPGYVGNFEYFTILSLVPFGISHESAFAYALLAHVFQFVPVIAVGLFFALRNGFQYQVVGVSPKAG